MTGDSRSALIEQYRRGHAEVVQALEAVTAGELDQRRVPTEWSIREVVHHLADSEMIAAVRLRRLVAEESPVIRGFDQELYARRLRYDSRPIEAALLVIEATRATTVELLGTISEADWQRTGIHTEQGVYTRERWLELNAGHTHEHAEEIRRNRAAWAVREMGLPG